MTNPQIKHPASHCKLHFWMDLDANFSPIPSKPDKVAWNWFIIGDSSSESSIGSGILLEARNPAGKESGKMGRTICRASAAMSHGGTPIAAGLPSASPSLPITALSEYSGGYPPRKEKMKNRPLNFAMIMTITALILGACGGAATGTPAPTSTPVDVAAIYTQAAQTVIARFTEQAPTITPTPLFTNTPIVPSATLLTPSPTVQKCEDSVFVEDVTIPDNTQMAVNQHFTKTWRVQNTGTCTWITTFYLGFAFGEAMSGQTKVPLPSAVAAGQTVDLSVSLTVPNKTGKLTGVWALFDDKGNTIGKNLTVVVDVGVPSSTPTAAATATNTVAPTTTFTATP
jgi:hypothetical protein